MGSNPRERIVGMNRYLFLICLLSGLTTLHAQTAIPLPTGFPNATNLSCMPIGDFDGDGSVDLSVSCTFSGTSNTYIMGVYSVKKAQYLLVLSNTLYTYSTPIFADFNGDGKNEIIVNNVLYSFSPSGSKKKAL
jgi:hypothetical protein